jgi:hypothetical protein
MKYLLFWIAVILFVPVPTFSVHGPFFDYLFSISPQLGTFALILVVLIYSAYRFGGLLSHFKNMEKTVQGILPEVDKKFQSMEKTVHAILPEVDRKLNDLKTQVDLQFNGVDERFKQVDQRFQQVDQRFKQVDQRFDQMEKRFDKIDDKLERITMHLLDNKPDNLRRTK